MLSAVFLIRSLCRCPYRNALTCTTASNAPFNADCSLVSLPFFKLADVWRPCWLPLGLFVRCLPCHASWCIQLSILASRFLCRSSCIFCCCFVFVFVPTTFVPFIPFLCNGLLNLHVHRCYGSSFGVRSCWVLSGFVQASVIPRLKHGHFVVVARPCMLFKLLAEFFLALTARGSATPLALYSTYMVLVVPIASRA